VKLQLLHSNQCVGGKHLLIHHLLLYSTTTSPLFCTAGVCNSWPPGNSGPVAEILWPAERARF